MLSGCHVSRGLSPLVGLADPLLTVEMPSTRIITSTVIRPERKIRRPEVPVIMLSTRDWPGPDYCDGVDYHIAKSNSPDEMIRAVERLMGDRHRKREKEDRNTRYNASFQNISGFRL
jgi:hypothetical protein